MQHPFRHFFSRSPRTIHGSMPNSRRTDGPQRKNPPLHATRGEAPASFSLFMSAVAVEITPPDSPCSAPEGGWESSAQYYRIIDQEVRARLGGEASPAFVDPSCLHCRDSRGLGPRRSECRSAAHSECWFPPSALRIADSLKFTLLQRHDFLADSNPLALAMIMILDTTFAHYSKEWGAMIGSAFDQGRVPSLQGRSARN
jgi:hypothetical protein